MEVWAGRVALVTGAASGIGAAVTSRLVKHGMKVIGCDKNVSQIQTMVDSLQSEAGSLFPLECDLRQEEQILAMFAEIRRVYGGLDVCVNCAGLGKIATLLEGETDSWREILEVNVLALSICTREAIRSMRERNVTDGHIVHMCSLRGYSITPHHKSPMYCASKFAVRALTESLRNELREINSNIRITAISPGTVKSGFALSMRGEEAGNAMYQESDYLVPEDVTDAIIYALSAPPHVQVHDIIIHPLTKPSGHE